MNLKVKCHGQRCSLSKLLLLSRIRGFKQAGTSGEKKNAFPLRRRIGKDTELSRRERSEQGGSGQSDPAGGLRRTLWDSARSGRLPSQQRMQPLAPTGHAELCPPTHLCISQNEAAEC